MKHPFLVGNSIYLRRIEEQDLSGPYFQWLNDPEVTRWMQNGLFPNNYESMKEFWQSHYCSNRDMVLAICSIEGDYHIGNIGLHRIHQVFRSAEIGILVGDKNYWGKGVATEAITLLTNHAFLRLNINRLYAGAVSNNLGCVKAFEKVGFQREGVSRQAYYCEGSYVDCINLSLLRDEWQSTTK